MSADLLIGLFFFVLAAVSAVGYVFVLRPSRNDAGTATIPAPSALDRLHQSAGTAGRASGGGRRFPPDRRSDAGRAGKRECGASETDDRRIPLAVRGLGFSRNQMRDRGDAGRGRRLGSGDFRPDADLSK